jgi:hypothetical protein
MVRFRRLRQGLLAELADPAALAGLGADALDEPHDSLLTGPGRGVTDDARGVLRELPVDRGDLPESPG